MCILTQLGKPESDSVKGNSGEEKRKPINYAIINYLWVKLDREIRLYK